MLKKNTRIPAFKHKEPTMKTTRPKSITGIGYLIMISGLSSVIHSLDTHSQVQPHFTLNQIAMFAVVAIGYLIAGIFILRGKNWARWLFVAVFLVLTADNFIVYGTEFALKILTFSGVMAGLFASVLFNRKTNAYFKGEKNDMASSV